MSNNNRRRVKLFVLNSECQWADHGTGHVSAMFTDQDNESNGIVLLVRSEDDGKVLLESRIQTNTSYQKQQDTLIVWSEADGSDIALSFQMKDGCDEIWEKICQVVGKDPSVDITQTIGEEEEEQYEDMADYSAPIELPKCELSKLDEICELCHSVLPSQMGREKLATSIEQENYIPKLLDLFHMCEDLDNVDGLNRLFEIFKSLFMMEKNSLFEIMFTEERIMDVIGVLEYDPNKKEPTKHRHFIENKVKFKEVLPIENKELLGKIHQTYRIQYIKDVLVPVPSLFEENMSTLSSFLFFSKIEIVNMIQEDEFFLMELFQKLTDDEISDEKRKSIVFFLKELCSLSQACQQANREGFLKVLSNHGLLSSLETLMNFDDEEMKGAIIDILCCVVEFTPSMVREYLSKEAATIDEDSILLNILIDQLICYADTGMGVQLVTLIRTLIDPENMGLGSNKMEKGEFLSFFYRHCMHVLTAPLFSITSENKLSGKDDLKSATVQDYITDILSFCVDHHTYHIKNYILSKDLLRRVLTLMQSRHKFIALTSLRFTRKIIGIKDEFYNRYIIKGKLLGPIVDAFLANGLKYNLLNSAIIELFEFIRLDDIKTLYVYIVENHMDQLKDVSYVETFKGLQIRYEQEKDRIKKNNTERNANHGIIHVNSSRKRRDDRSLDEDEENWFDSEEDDISDTSNSSSGSPLASPYPDGTSVNSGTSTPSPLATPSPTSAAPSTTASTSPPKLPCSSGQPNPDSPLCKKFKDVDLLDSVIASTQPGGMKALPPTPPAGGPKTRLAASLSSNKNKDSSSPPSSSTADGKSSSVTTTTSSENISSTSNTPAAVAATSKSNNTSPLTGKPVTSSFASKNKQAAAVTTAGSTVHNIKIHTKSSCPASSNNGNHESAQQPVKKAAAEVTSSSPAANTRLNGTAADSTEPDSPTAAAAALRDEKPTANHMEAAVPAIANHMATRNSYTSANSITSTFSVKKINSPLTKPTITIKTKTLGGLVDYDIDDDESDDDGANDLPMSSPAKKQKMSST